MQAYVFLVKYAVRPARKTKIVWILSSVKQGNNRQLLSRLHLQPWICYVFSPFFYLFAILWKFHQIYIWQQLLYKAGLLLLCCAIGFSAECPLPTVELCVPNKCMIVKEEWVVSGSWFIEVFNEWNLFLFLKAFIYRIIEIGI